MKKINSVLLKQALISAAYNMENNKERINALNVFPVPDGDTGTNMAATIMAGIKNLDDIPDGEIGLLMSKMAHNMLLGARGNSGVILSQIFKGFSDALQHKNNEVNGFDLVSAFRAATSKAYDSVLKPVEGTILTVIREVTEDLEKKVSPITEIEEILTLAFEFARKSCDNTPNLLHILKEVGVTDSGGEGLICIIDGLLRSIKGEPVSLSLEQVSFDGFVQSQEVFDGEFGYCTEFAVELKRYKNFSRENFVKRLEKETKANSIVVVRDEKILKVHAHVLKPGDLLNLGQKYGEFLKIKSENMTEQANESKETAATALEIRNKKILSGIISCNTGQGIINIMKENGAHFIIEGGQTNNPSIQDIIDAIQTVNSNVIFILPNNSNIMLAAQQAVQTISDKKVIVIPTKTQMQGVAAIMHFNEDTDWEDNKELMDDVIKTVDTVEITRASRTTSINGIKVEKGEYISIVNGKVIDSESTNVEAAITGIKAAITEETEIITIYYGAEASKNEANEIATFININYDSEVEIKSGNQDIYDFLISIE